MFPSGLFYFNTHAICPSSNSGSMLSPLIFTPKLADSGIISFVSRIVSFGPYTRKFPGQTNTAFSYTPINLINGMILHNLDNNH